MARRSDKALQKWEISLIKTMLARNLVQQDIHAYFSRPTRSINHARISAIHDGTKHKAVKAASDVELDDFLESWPNTDPSTGLYIQDNELLVKAREAMIAAVHTFNSAGLYFRTEIFIVISVIAWTYLLHAYYKHESIDYRHKKAGVVEKTPSGADKFWELGKCLAHDKCPLDKGVINNLKLLYEIRHEIEHRSTDSIDDALSPELQACCINFNDAIKTLFSKRLALEKLLPIALQFVTYDGAHRQDLISADLPQHIATTMENFHNDLTEEEKTDPKFRYRVAFVPQLSGKASNADLAVKFVKLDSSEAEKTEHVHFKEVERPKFLPSEIVKKVNTGGYAAFKIYDHTLLWKQLDARKPGKGFGVQVAQTWYWYEHWFEKVIEKLAEGWRRP